MVVVTNTRTRSLCDRELMTEDVVAALQACVDEYNKGSCAHIYSIEKDADFDNPDSGMYKTLHIVFEYYGECKPDGRVLCAFVRMADTGLRFHHTFNYAAHLKGMRKYGRKYYAEHREKMQAYSRKYYADHRKETLERQRAARQNKKQ